MKRILLLLLVLGTFVLTSTGSRFAQYAHAGLFDTIAKEKDATSLEDLKGKDSKSTTKKHSKKAERDYKRNTKQMKQKLNIAEKFCSGDRKNNSSCKRYLDGAKKRYDKIPIPYLSSPDVILLKKRYDALEKKAAKLEKEETDRKKANEDLNKASYAYRNEISQLLQVFWELNKGKEKKAASSTDEITKKAKVMTENFSAMEKLEKKFHDQYAVILKKNKLELGGYTPEQIYDLVKNRVKYRDMYVKAACESKATFYINQNQNLIKEFLKYKKMHYNIIDSLSSKFNKYYKNVFDEINAAYKHINATPPKWMHTKYMATKAEYQRALKKVVATSKWNKGKYPYTTSDMKTVAKNYADKHQLKLISIGMPGNRWTIVKNKLTGIPLYKTGGGAVLFKKKGESHYRIQTITFKRQYNGKSYERISSCYVSDYVQPCRK